MKIVSLSVRTSRSNDGLLVQPSILSLFLTLGFLSAARPIAGRGGGDGQGGGVPAEAHLGAGRPS